MAFNIQDLNKVDDNNQQNWPEGTQKVNEVNNAGRADEGMLARWFADWNGSKITAGTATAYTITSDTVPTAYYDGFLLVAEIHVENTGAATLNADSLGAVNIVKNGGEALEAGDLPAGHIAIFVYRGTDFNLIATKIGSAGTKNTGTAIGDVVELEDVSGSAGLPAVDGSQLTGIANEGAVGDYQVFTASGTFEKGNLPASVTHVTVQVLGGGGGGGGANTVTNYRGVGGAAGGGAIKRIAVSALASSEIVTVGVAGGAGTTGGTPGDGGDGGTSSFGAHVSATGGAGGTAATGTAIGGVNGGIGSNGDLNLRGGRSGTMSNSGGANSAEVSQGGDAPFGYGFGAQTVAAAASGYGAGGGPGDQGGANGGIGGTGLIIVRW